ncbi:HET-domain-containing protein [Cucurbitaria berberidis CBS 394.84]|uniref:HET-domain-containing protein n=1 Tax=Cucurbitaria berberidis CBS 394.84 TaxID=1168544 RepID=A0A9P4GGJ8_9PLEO|nr:HET-domain-containing protein [Cucurbitaria berberidis CBS 394.84]KAF1845056.1 HET-domain-containing protein [Cucurbitaria berberidis CBS 394.84]
MALVLIERTLDFSPPLCSFCQVLIASELDRFKVLANNLHYPERDESSKRRNFKKREKCGLCDYTINILDVKGTDWRAGEKEKLMTMRGLLYPKNKAGDQGRMDVSLGSGSRLTTTLCTLLINPTKHAEPRLWSSLAPEKSSISRLTLSKTWLSNCLANHGQCKTLEAQTSYGCPTRLIDVSSETPHLVSFPPGTNVEYVALSHCWGRHQPITTTEGNIMRHGSAIPLSSMPKTFRDAIMITKELEIQYIWIDSLCIIQDSVSDWEHEAAQMASVYLGALFAVAAVWGTDGTCGCFHDHQPSLRISIDEKRKTDTHITEETHHMYLRPFPEGKRHLAEAVLNTRAWTLQEIVLSRRTIFFAEDQMYWYCTSLYESEDGLDSVQAVADTALNLPSLGPVARHGNQSKDMLYESWQVTMKSYSARHLTKGGDKFAALAGITEFFGGLVEDKAVAGLWKGDLGRGLMWQVPVGEHGKMDRDVVAKLSVPSWSWAKMKGQVDTSVADTEMCVQNLDPAVVWEKLPMTSKIQYAYIRGRGRTLKILEVQKEPDEACFCLGSRRVTVQVDACEAWNCNVYWRMDECTEEIEKDLSFLLVRFNDVRDKRKSDESVTEIEGLVIAAAGDTHSDYTFRRIGAGQVIGFPWALYKKIPLADFTLISEFMGAVFGKEVELRDCVRVQLSRCVCLAYAKLS